MMASTVMVRRRNWNLRQSAGTYWWGREQGRNEEARRHLGLETQRQWSDLAILRTTPALLGLFSLVTLWAARLEAERGISPEWRPLVPETRAHVQRRPRPGPARTVDGADFRVLAGSPRRLKSPG